MTRNIAHDHLHFICFINSKQFSSAWYCHLPIVLPIDINEFNSCFNSVGNSACKELSGHLHTVVSGKVK